MRKFLICTLAVLLCGLSRAASLPDSLKERLMKRVVPAEVAHEYATDLTQKISWQRSLQDAEALAKKENKLVFWMHMLGNLEGDT